MSDPVISHSDIKSFAETHVNLDPDDAKKYRGQVNSLRDRLEVHIAANPGFALTKMLHAGSVAKGTGLSTLNDLDIAVYLKKEDIPIADQDLVPWLGDRLFDAYSGILKRDQFDTSSPNCVTIRFRGTGLDVDVVPVLYDGAKDDRGFLVNKDTGEKLLTSIPLHLQFIRKRKETNPNHYAQVVRIVKWWAALKKREDDSFKCKSFMLELILAKLADDGMDISNYARATESFFNYIVKTGLEERISFSDYYSSSALPSATGAAIEIFDPVNPANNISSKYSTSDRDLLVRMAEEAGDALSEAHYATTKQRAVECWQRVLGPSFRL